MIVETSVNEDRKPTSEAVKSNYEKYISKVSRLGGDITGVSDQQEPPAPGVISQAELAPHPGI